MAKQTTDERLQEMGREFRETAERNGRESSSRRKHDPPPLPIFPEPKLASHLEISQHAGWLWNGYLTRGGVTLMSALWKAGKTTLLAHLLRSLETGGNFCGRAIDPGHVLMVTEESENRWAERVAALDLRDHISFIIRPFNAKPDWPSWELFLAFLKAKVEEHPVDLIVFDPLVNLWPVRDENDASQVQAALMPLHKIAERPALLLIHHNRKGDGQEATATRGSGALPGFVDIIMEMRRYDPANRKDRKRVLTGYGRYDETPEELVIELTEQGYEAQGDRRAASCRDLTAVLLEVLPTSSPGLTKEEIVEEWPGDSSPKAQRLTDALNSGAEMGKWQRDGKGYKGNPFRFWRPVG